jgi:hypothetical protein
LDSYQDLMALLAYPLSFWALRYASPAVLSGHSASQFG